MASAYQVHVPDEPLSGLGSVHKQVLVSTGASEPVDEGTMAEGIFVTAFQGTGKRLAKLKDDEGGGAVSSLLFDTGADMASTWR